MEAFHFFKERLQEQEARALPGTRLASHSRTQRRAIWYRPEIINLRAMDKSEQLSVEYYSRRSGR